MVKISKNFNFSKHLETLAPQTRSNKIIRFFPDSDLRCSHEGLKVIAMEHKIDPWNLKPGEFLVFANRRMSALKIYAPGNIIAYVKSPDHRQIDLNIVRLIPRFFNGTEFNYSGAVAEMLRVKMAA